MIKDFNVRPETSKLVWENIGETLEDIGTGNYFLNMTPIAQERRPRIDKMGLHQIKNLLHIK
jgi:hypothetical protein